MRRSLVAPAPTGSTGAPAIDARPATHDPVSGTRALTRVVLGWVALGSLSWAVVVGVAWTLLSLL